MNQNVKKVITISTFSIFFILILAYSLFVSKDLIFGIKIKNVNLTDGAVVTENILKINGQAKNAINLTLNGRTISIDQAGNFSETIALLPGYNIINLKAQDKFGYTDEKIYQLIYKK